MTKKRAGRTPWKRALIGPGTIVGLPGRRVDIKTDDGLVVRGAHIDDILLIPEEVDDWEKEEVVLGPSEPDRLPRSPGQMIEQAGKGVVPQTKAVTKAIRGLGLQTIVVYTHWARKSEVRVWEGDPVERLGGDSHNPEVRPGC